MTITRSPQPAPTTSETVESVVAWAHEMLALLNEAQELWDQPIAEAVRLLRPLVVPTGGSSSLTSGLLAVRVPHRGTSEARSLAENLARPVARHHELADLLEHAPAVVREIEAALGHLAPARSRRLLSRRAERSVRQAAADQLAHLKDWADKTGYAEDLFTAVSRVSPARGGALAEPAAEVVQAVETLAPVLGAVRPHKLSVLESQDAEVLADVVVRGRDLLGVREGLEHEVTTLFRQVQDRMVRRQLEDLPVSVLKEASRGVVRVSVIERAGMTSVQDVLDMQGLLPGVAGLGHQSARSVLATARELERQCRENLRLRVDWDSSDSDSTSLVMALHRILVLDDRLDSHRERLAELVGAVEPLRPALARAESLVLLHRHSPRRGADVTRLLQEHAGWTRAAGLADLLGTTSSDAAHSAAAWEDFKGRVLAYQGLLGQIVGIEVDADSAQGHLPSEVVQAVESQALDTSFLRADLRATLRGYQSFGARYALVQRKVLLGDEMGLGKTIQALTVMSHLASRGKNHFLVVVPPAVLVNWLKEVAKHSVLDAHRIHGPDRERALRRWQSAGGVAVTSYGLLSSMPLNGVQPSLLVVDEAHMVKNPTTQRSQAVSALADASERVMYMTGTPLENRVEDFINLVGQLQPGVVDNIDPAAMVLGAEKFRQAVAPVYLRRSSNDVLTELPELVESEEWLDLSKKEVAAYLDALDAKDFHGMRHVAITADPEGSRKLERIRELVDEAVSNRRKVLVYSFYRDVLDRVRETLGDRVVGVISGSMPPTDRQRLVDEFTKASSPPVLVSQIEAGGVGLNIQAATVVILCEPQVKPSLENQAIKRAHRMGQPNTVQVHRLLTNDSIDERMLEILARKVELFDQLVAHSEVATASVEAMDVTEVALRKEVLAREQERLAEELRARMVTKPRPAEVEPQSAADAPDDPKSEGGATGAPSNLEPALLSRPSQTPRPVDYPAAPGLAVHVCPSCSRPIDVLGHCGCS